MSQEDRYGNEGEGDAELFAEKVTEDRGPSGLNEPQPAPRGSSEPPVWPAVILDFAGLPRVMGPAQQQILLDMKERDDIGAAKYGERLRPHNGRDALVDAYQETLDQAVYLKQYSLEHPEDQDAYWLYRSALDMVWRVHALVTSRTKS